jgi:hypothetical protein
MIPGASESIPDGIGIIPGPIGMIPDAIGIIPGSIGIIPDAIGIIPGPIEMIPGGTGIIPDVIGIGRDASGIISMPIRTRRRPRPTTLSHLIFNFLRLRRGIRIRRQRVSVRAWLRLGPRKETSTMTKTPNNKATHTEQDTKAMAGVDLHLASAGTMIIGGEQFTPATLKAVFQADLDATSNSDAAKTTLKLKVQTAQAARQRTATVRKNLKVYLVGQNGPNAVQVLEDFGFTVPKPPGPKTVEAKALGQAKAQSTRLKQRAAKAAVEAPPPPATPAAK